MLQILWSIFLADTDIRISNHSMFDRCIRNLDVATDNLQALPENYVNVKIVIFFQLVFYQNKDGIIKNIHCYMVQYNQEFRIGLTSNCYFSTVKTKVEISHQNWCVHLDAYSTWFLAVAAHQMWWEYLCQNMMVKNIQLGGNIIPQNKV